MKTIFVAGHKGMVGSAICRQLSELEGVNIVTSSRSSCDLSNQQSVNDFFNQHDIDEVYLAAAKVGGIHANNIYPKLAEQPMTEQALLSGQLETTNEPYAIAKIAGIKLCESYNRQYGTDFRSVMPTNLYGHGDNFHPENSHVIPAMMQRFHQAVLEGAQQVVVWGSGKPMREFLYVDDMAAACVHVMGLSKTQFDSNVEPMLSHINVGTGIDCTIRELAETMAKVVGFKGELVFDTSKPDGTPRKLMDVSRLSSMGWQATITLETGLEKTYQWFLDNIESIRM